jgi:hypothetical protein
MATISAVKSYIPQAQGVESYPLKKLSKDKHSSIFYLAVSDNEKKVLEPRSQEEDLNSSAYLEDPNEFEKVKQHKLIRVRKLLSGHQYIQHNYTQHRNILHQRHSA